MIVGFERWIVLHLCKLVFKRMGEFFSRITLKQSKNLNAIICVYVRSHFQAALQAMKLGLALNLLRQRSSYGDFHYVDKNGCNMLHVLAAHADKDPSPHGKIMQVHFEFYAI